MRFSQAALNALVVLSASSVLLDAFTPTTSLRREGAVAGSSALQAFQMSEEQKQLYGNNMMFEGPTPLVKERDACGVGFVANTSSGG